MKKLTNVLLNSVSFDAIVFSGNPFARLPILAHSASVPGTATEPPCSALGPPTPPRRRSRPQPPRVQRPPLCARIFAAPRRPDEPGRPGRKALAFATAAPCARLGQKLVFIFVSFSIRERRDLSRFPSLPSQSSVAPRACVRPPGRLLVAATLLAGPPAVPPGASSHIYMISLIADEEL